MTNLTLITEKHPKERRYNDTVQYTNNTKINAWIDQIHHLIQKSYPKVVVTEQPGFHSVNYGLLPGMKEVRCYIICYDQKANLGFPHGIDLIQLFPNLKGTGKTHRHLEINESLMANPKELTRLLTTAFKQK